MDNVTDQMFRRIGQGFCGTVWAAPIGTSAIKREDGGPGRSLYNDYIMHQKVLQSLSPSESKICVPRCHQYVHENDRTWWDKQISKFPKEFQIPCNVLVTDRIPPFPEAVRDTIINAYCPESLRSLTKFSEPDQDCLIRPYLGRRRRLVKQSRFKAFSLRNYPLHLDQIEELALNGILYARIMAETLADLYWRAHVDANDVEFVLAPPKGGHASWVEGRSEGGHTSWFERHLRGYTSWFGRCLRKGHGGRFKGFWAHPDIIESDVLGEHVVWILDFDCCKRMSLDEIGVDQAARAFCENDPYYPRPGRDNIKDQTLWNEFKDRFLEASEAILDQKSSEARLPALWIKSVEQRNQSLKSIN